MLKLNGKFQAHHGDVQIFSVDAIPSNAKKVENTFIAKSERSGHAHALCGDYDMYEVDGGFLVEIKDNEAILNHAAYSLLTEKTMKEPKSLPIADHKPITIKPGKYFIGIQQRKKHFSKVWEKVQD